MKIIMGPILGFRRIDARGWNVSALVVSDEAKPGKLAWRIDGISQVDREAIAIHQHKGRHVHRYDLSIVLTSEERTVTYTVPNGDENSFQVPAKDQSPRMAYASCNGFSQPSVMKKIKEKNRQWLDLANHHDGGKGFHLLLMGGDQVYADEMWRTVRLLEAWAERSVEQRRRAKFTANMDRQVKNFYFELYCKRWKQPEVASVISAIPTVMMWDDHDIFDGWGSYHAKDLESPVYRGIFGHARDAFNIFQQQMPAQDRAPATLPDQPAFSYAHRVGGVALLVLDMRSERTLARVMGQTTWDAVTRWLAGLPSDGVVDHLLVMSSIPVAHPDLSWAESFIGFIPGLNELEDDLQDHWNSRGHKEERLRLIHRLLQVAEGKNIRVTILSGDVHVAAIGAIESSRNKAAPRNAAVMTQLTSSGIVHPPPPGVMKFLLELLGRNAQEVDRDITARMMKFTGTSERFITRRNWLGLTCDDENDGQRRLWAEFHMEGDAKPYTKVIHPVLIEGSRAGPAGQDNEREVIRPGASGRRPSR